jgi:RNA dependent RNA polymerase
MFFLIVPNSDLALQSAVLRRFGHHECFLRVTFSDESRSRLYHHAGLDQQSSVGQRYLKLMVDGFQLAGRKWEFLGYSMSGLREHSVWFVNPFKSDEDPHILMDAARIRSLLVSMSLSCTGCITSRIDRVISRDSSENLLVSQPAGLKPSHRLTLQSL